MNSNIKTMMNVNRRISSPVSDDTPTQKNSSELQEALREYNEIVSREKEKKENPSDIHQCDHASRVEENNVSTCINCGEELNKRFLHHQEWRIYDSNKTTIQPRRAVDCSIKKEMETLGLSKIIVEKALSLYSQVTGNKILKGNHRRSVICACVFYAYKLTGNDQPYNDIIKLVHIKKTDGSKGIKFFKMNSFHLPEVQTLTIKELPEVLIKSLVEKICVDVTNNIVEEITRLYHKVYNRSSLLNNCRTHSFISGLVFFWICLRKIDMKVGNFASVAELSPWTIIKITKEISSILKTEIVIK